jgi:Dyp-type peroxidase family
MGEYIMSNTDPQLGAQLDPLLPPADLPLRDSEEIQGNILAGFNKDHQTFLFLRFADTASGRAYITELWPRIATTKQVATFNAQFSNARRLSGGDDPQTLKALWVNVGLTSHGLRLLAPGIESDLQPFFAFNEGPARRAPLLNDAGPSDPAGWVIGGPDQPPVDVIVTVAADDPADLDLELTRQRALAATRTVTILFEQRGETLPEERAGHEHFGFKDGVSQPAVRGFHPENPVKPGERLGHPGTEIIAAGEFILGHEGEFGTQPVPDWMQDGSFQVFRRLNQDVPGFWAQVLRQRDTLPPDDTLSADALAAKLVGRWRSGTPLAHAPDRDNRSAQDRTRDNDFKYDDDPDGIKTPRFAHIRKMYPRNHGVFGDRTRRIMRRGVPFGQPFDPSAGRGHGVDAERGLLFNVFMASIEGQFEFLQQTWANESRFPGNVVGDGRVDGPDPVIGTSPDPVDLRREDRPPAALDFRRFVHATGAVYAFAPSINALRKLGNGELGGDIPDDVLRVGGQAFITRRDGDPWRLREQPNLGGRILGLLQPGTQMTLLEGPVAADGHDWWRVETTDGRTGWVAAGGLVAQPD